MAHPKRRKAALRSAGAVTADAIREQARALAEDPAPALPLCEGGCVLFSPMNGARKGILAAHAARDDDAKLEKLARGGNDVARAYAATLLLARAEKIPYVAELRLGALSAPYVIRGKAKPFPLAGLQNWSDRQLRLLAYSPWVKKRGLHVWSTTEGVVCTGKRAAPPDAFLDAEAEDLGLRAKGARRVCEHGGSDAGDAVALAFRGSDATLERCRACLDETPLLHAAARHLAAPRVMHVFQVRATLAPLVGPAPDVAFDVPETALDAYRSGRLSDVELLDAARAARADALRALPQRILVAGDRAFATPQEFVDALAPSPAESRALHAGLAGREKPTVLDKPTAARAIADLWNERGLAMLEAAAGDAATAQRLHKEKVTPEEVSELMRRAEREGVRLTALSALPRYDRLPPAAQAADAIARTYRTDGQDAAVRAAMERASSGKAKGVALAFLDALGAAKGQDWRFAQADREVAAGLGPDVEALLRGEPARYHSSLVAVSRRTGEVAEFAPRA